MHNSPAEIKKRFTLALDDRVRWSFAAKTSLGHDADKQKGERAHSWESQAEYEDAALFAFHLHAPSGNGKTNTNSWASHHVEFRASTCLFISFDVMFTMT